MIGVTIPFFKAKDKLDKCLKALSEQGLGVDVQIKDNSEQNDLYTKAVNVGLRTILKKDLEYALILTQDCYLRPGCLQELLLAAKENKDAGLICPVQMSGIFVTFAGGMDAWPAGKHASPPLTDLQGKKPYDCYWGNGACMLVRMSAAREVGLLDENLKHICSDSDFSFTMRSRGFRVLVQPKALCDHELDSSAGNAPEWLLETMGKDKEYFFKKWISGQRYMELSFEGKKLAQMQMQAAASAQNHLLR